MSCRRPARFADRSRAALAVGCAGVVLAACGSSPMPKMPPLVPSRITPPAGAASDAPLAAPSPGTPASGPLPSAASASAVATPASAVASSPLESPGVAARFPVPATDIMPPLPSGDVPFTSPEALATRLRDIAATVPATPSANPTSIALVEAGRSQDGAPLQALVFTRHPAATAPVIVRGGRPTVLLVAQQHGDEPAGAEALLAVAQSLATGPLQDVLDAVNVVVVPRANPDGARRNQAAAANGVDLDTDHLLVATPEARALARLARDYRPLLVVDLHEYPVDPAYAERLGGAERADLLVQYAGTARLPEFIVKASEAWFRQPLVAGLKDQGIATDWLHRPTGPRRAAMGSPRPDSVRNANGLRNAVSFALESRGGNLGPVHLERRVATHVQAVSALLRSSAQRAEDLVKLRKYVDAAVRADLCQGQMLVDPVLSPSEHALAVLDPATGADRTVTVSWDSALALRDGRVRSRPCGYWLGADQGEAVTRLRALGVRVEQLSEPLDMQADANAGAPVAGEREFLEFNAPTGSYYVPLSQPWGNLAVAALEPDAAQGFLAQRVVTSPNRLRKVTVVPKVRRTLVP